MQKYRVLPPCRVAGFAPGELVTREQVEAFGGPDAHIRFDVLVGTHLEPVKDEPEAQARKASK